MRKRFFLNISSTLILIISIVLNSILGIGGATAYAATQVDGDQYITKTELKRDNNTTVNNGDTIKINSDRLVLLYEFNINHNDTYKNGDTIVFSIPNEFTVVSNFSFDMNSPTGEKVAETKIVRDKTSGYQAQMTFTTDYIETHSSFEGGMDLKVVLNETFVKEGNVSIELPLTTVDVIASLDIPGTYGGTANVGNSWAKNKEGKIWNAGSDTNSPGDYVAWDITLGREAILQAAGVESFDKIESIYISDTPKDQILIPFKDITGWENDALVEYYYKDVNRGTNSIPMGFSSDLKSFNEDVLAYFKAGEFVAANAYEVETELQQLSFKYATRPEKGASFAGMELVNEATVTIKLKGSDATKSWVLSDSVIWNEGDGYIQGKTAGIKIKKVDSASGSTLEGAHFDLYRKNADGTSTKISELITNKDGISQYPDNNTTGLVIGSYYLKETVAPKGYALDETQHDFSITDKELVQTTTQGIFYLDETIQNSRETTNITGSKYWNDDNATDRPEMIKVDLLQNG
ncbi:SpaA isopeptide-forming pilin-related protein, partial [Bacillus cereus]|uniref:SpaA isopeptide-forming pilin-related protein n=1 Tax=Bacillus cereus TaxID=1396 RepID=UPI002AC0F043